MAGALAAIAAMSIAPAHAAAACSDADASPAAEVRGATLCLLNAERAERGLQALRSNRSLALAAGRHAEDMVEQRYFAHVSRAGASFVDRVRRTDYLGSGTRSWSLGENIAWGSGNKATARSIVRSWMNSPGHRANILSGRFREIGIGVERGAPVRGLRNGGTYVTAFGSRS